jgi:hypothetical protein
VNLAYVWYNPVERVMIENILRADRPSWRLTTIPDSDLADLGSVVRLLKSDEDAVMLHLSKPPCVALKAAELVNEGRLRPRLLLMSKSDADPTALSALFSGRLDPDRDIASMADKIEDLLGRTPSFVSDRRSLEDAIVRVLNTDSVFQYLFRLEFPVLYRAPFTIEDYNKFAAAYLRPEAPNLESRQAVRVFISHAAEDLRLAMELRQYLAESGVASFLAARDLEGGDRWEMEIRGAIRRCSEMLVLITPRSID